MKKLKTGMLTQIALLSAILIVMAFTPLGYLPIGPIKITFLCIPVVIAAITCGVKGGAILGLVFGMTSLVQCFGMDVFGTTLMNINPFYMTVVCLLPRVLVGVFAALVYKTVTGTLSVFAASFAGTVTNTVLFLGLMVLLFGQSDYLKQFGSTAWEIIVAMAGVNALVEAVVCTILGGIIAKAVLKFLKR